MSSSTEPEFERSYFKPNAYQAEPFESMDLPYYGGKLEKCTDSLMEVTYPSDGLGPDQLREFWPDALKAEGWAAKTEDQLPDGSYIGTFDTSDGKGGSLSIKPLGSLWVVTITIL